ncbi:MAG: IS1-like element transposase [Xenococcaceae cyanobacterium MO_207.B15]|nr:IS1-like element transposase [Xenococcaceae cyanobacterium MO_207.B15]
MTFCVPVQCPHCHSTDVIKHGKSSNGKQRYRCCNPHCLRVTFSLNLDYPGRDAKIKQKIVEMNHNGNTVREISRNLKISTATVIKELKKNLRQ